MVSRYSHGGKLLSQNCGIDKFKMSPQPHTFAPGPPHDQVAYESYVEFSQRVGTTPVSFEEWYLRDAEINREDVRARHVFHSEDHSIDSLVGGESRGFEGELAGYEDVIARAKEARLESLRAF